MVPLNVDIYHVYTQSKASISYIVPLTLSHLAEISFFLYDSIPQEELLLRENASDSHQFVSISDNPINRNFLITNPNREN